MRVIGLLALTLSVAPAQHSLQFDVGTTTETSRGGKAEKATAEASFAIANPGRMRIESNEQGMTFISMSKREHTVMYSLAKKAGAEAQGGMGMKLPDMTLVQTNDVREETIEIDGGKHDCWVVECKITGMAVTLWIDKKLMIDVQSTAVAKIAGTPETEVHIKEVKKNLKIDEPIDAAMFAPAANSKELKTLSLFTGAAPRQQSHRQDGARFRSARSGRETVQRVVAQRQAGAAGFLECLEPAVPHERADPGKTLPGV